MLEAAAELRVPVPKLNTHAYAFYEHCSDLGSSKEATAPAPSPTPLFLSNLVCPLLLYSARFLTLASEPSVLKAQA